MENKEVCNTLESEKLKHRSSNIIIDKSMDGDIEYSERNHDEDEIYEFDFDLRRTISRGRKMRNIK